MGAETNLVDEVADLPNIVFLGIFVDRVFVGTKTGLRIRIIKIHTVPDELLGLPLILASFHQFRQLGQTRIPFLDFVPVIEVHVGTLGAFHHEEFCRFIAAAFVASFLRGRAHLLSFDDILGDDGPK